jgi:hypothetical protein
VTRADVAAETSGQRLNSCHKKDPPIPSGGTPTPPPGCRAYRLEVSCVEAHADRIRLTGINTGSAIYPNGKRGSDTFQNIDTFPFNERRRSRNLAHNVVEVAVINGLPNVTEFVVRVERLDDTTGPKVLYEACISAISLSQPGDLYPGPR